MATRSAASRRLEYRSWFEAAELCLRARVCGTGAGHENQSRLSCQATLSGWKISNPRVIRFQQQSDFWKPRWFKPNLQTFQERLGGRVALVTEINIADASTPCYNLHLESRSNDELRLSQLNDVLEDSARYDSASLVVIAGDLNVDASKPGIEEALARAGFRAAVPTARRATTPARHLLEAGRHIDWAFVRGQGEAKAGKVHTSVRGSDHYPISFELRLPG